MSEPVRILHIVGAMYPGGMENFIMNLYRSIDRNRFQFDFCVNVQKENDYSAEIDALGGRIYVLPRLTRHPVQNLREIRRIVADNHYPVVIRHTANALIAPQLLAAKKSGAITICHSHNETDPKKFLHRCGRVLLRKAADVRLACSPAAGEWMYGNLDYQVIRNAIDIRSFAFSPSRGNGIRREFGLSGQHVYGNISNFIASKNHSYLLKICQEILRLDPSAVCFCIGEGELRPQIEAEIRSLGLEGNVILTGIRDDVPDFMSVLDVLIFPSIFEGLPLTLIEAQAAGLPSLISDTITKDVIVTEGLVEPVSITADPAVWAERAVRMAREESEAQADHSGCVSPKPYSRACQYDKIAEAGYEIHQLARWYEEFFTELLRTRKNRNGR